MCAGLKWKCEVSLRKKKRHQPQTGKCRFCCTSSFSSLFLSSSAARWISCWILRAYSVSCSSLSSAKTKIFTQFTNRTFSQDFFYLFVTLHTFSQHLSGFWNLWDVLYVRVVHKLVAFNYQNVRRNNQMWNPAGFICIIALVSLYTCIWLRWQSKLSL